LTGTTTSTQTVVAPARVSAIKRPWYSSRLSTPETGARLRRKNGNEASIRPASAPSSASIRAISRRKVATSSGTSMASSQATKRDM
jgi:hypothetical protein